ncbi:unnamed protein product [Anisakis simplex]|nr:unnamed protein product [Anisakis simplex]
MFMYINEVKQLEKELPTLIDEWKDEQDPRIPDQNAWVPEEELPQRLAAIEEAKRRRRCPFTSLLLISSGNGSDNQRVFGSSIIYSECC